MWVKSCLREIFFKAFEKSDERRFLGAGPCVSRSVVPVETADVCYAYRFPIMSLAVCAFLTYGSPGFNCSVKADDKMIANVVPAIPDNMEAPDIFGSNIFLEWSSSAVDDNFGYISHFFSSFPF